MRTKSAILSAALLLVAASGVCRAQQFDRTVHDFGKVTQADGPLSCSFILTNTGTADLYINSVTSSCGCTGVSWTKTAIRPGATGEVKATYSNDEGPYPFDKTLTVYLSGASRPTVLHLRGVVKKK